jgi:CheY-like chemotaxis protein
MAMILAVDDRSTNRDFLMTLLTYHGHRVLQAADGAEALAVLAETPVDLVVTDILMPTMDGYELVRRMREESSTADVPVIFFTGSYNQREARPRRGLRRRPRADQAGRCRSGARGGRASAVEQADVRRAATSAVRPGAPSGGQRQARRNDRRTALPGRPHVGLARDHPATRLRA